MTGRTGATRGPARTAVARPEAELGAIAVEQVAKRTRMDKARCLDKASKGFEGAVSQRTQEEY